MKSFKFGTIINKTNSAVLVSQFIYQKNAPAIQNELFHIPSNQTLSLNKAIEMQMVEEKVYTAPLLIKKETDTNIEMLLSVTWGEAIFLDMKVQNLHTQETIEIETIIKRAAINDNCIPNVDLIIEGEQLEKSHATIYYTH